MKVTRRILGELTWEEAQAPLASHAIALLPLGATEAHGPHLPLATDVIISDGMARRAAEALENRGHRTLILPTLAYGVTEYAAPFSGTLGISAATLAALIRDLAEGLEKQGVTILCLVNSHLEPAHIAVLRQLSASPGPGKLTILFPDKTRRRWVQTLSEEFQQGACHAGCYETSLVLADRPELVREEIRAGLQPLPINLSTAMRAGAKTFVEAGADRAYFGTPSVATGEEGEATYRLLVDMIVTTIEECLTARGQQG